MHFLFSINLHFLSLGGTIERSKPGHKEIVLSIHELSGGGTNLIERDWLSHFGVSLTTIETDR